MSKPKSSKPSKPAPKPPVVREPAAAESTPGEAAPAASPKGVLDGASLKGIPRVVSLIVLLAVVLLIGVMFFRVMASFLIPLFLAAVLTVVFKPLHNWVLDKLGNRNQLAALATTSLISLGVVVPTAVLGWMAYVETSHIVRVSLAAADSAAEAADTEAVDTEAGGDEPANRLILPEGVEREVETAAEQGAETPAEPAGWTAALMARLEPITNWYHDTIDANAELETGKLAQTAARYAVQIGLVGVQSLVGFFLGLGIMIFALYYFLADGPSIIVSLMHLSPLDDDYERELLNQFANVSRAVVLATVLAAVVQGLLAGVGYYFVLESWSPPSIVAAAEAAGESVAKADRIDPPLFLLTVLTMLLAIVPFVGATAVWLPVAVWVYFVQGDLWSAVGLAIYGFAVVSSIDNLIKPYVLHGQSNLHPLLALLSVLGGLQLLGPIGILVGPMLVAFMQALLLMLRKELDFLGDESEGEQVAAAVPN